MDNDDQAIRWAAKVQQAQNWPLSVVVEEASRDLLVRLTTVTGCLELIELGAVGEITGPLADYIHRALQAAQAAQQTVREMLLPPTLADRARESRQTGEIGQQTGDT